MCEEERYPGAKFVGHRNSDKDDDNPKKGSVFSKELSTGLLSIFVFYSSCLVNFFDGSQLMSLPAIPSACGHQGMNLRW